MKITCIYGSPRRKGNSATLADNFFKILANNSDQVTEFRLNDLVYKGCRGCMSCKGKSETCVIKDDLATVLESVRQSDILILATPVYYYDIPGQVKCFIDRTWSYLKPDFAVNKIPSRLEIGKTLVWIQTQGDSDSEKHKDIFLKYNIFFKLYGFTKSYLIRACGVNEVEDLKQKTDVVKQIFNAAQSIREIIGHP